MIKTVATPSNKSYVLSIPENYIGKRIEILFYALEEITNEEKAQKKTSLADFWNKISDDTAIKIQKSISASKNEWR